MTFEQFISLLYSPQGRDTLFVIAGTLTVIAFVMVLKMPKKRRRD